MTIIRCYRYWKLRRNTESKKPLWIENYSFKGMCILYYQNWDFNKLTYMAIVFVFSSFHVILLIVILEACKHTVRGKLTLAQKFFSILGMIKIKILSCKCRISNIILS